MSPSYATGGYPSSQLCTWRFLVQESNPPTEQVLIKFPEFNLQKGGDGDVVKIYSGWDEKAPLLAEFSGDRPPPAKGVAFKSPVVFLVFRSDSRGKSKGFRGLFVNQREFKGFYVVKDALMCEFLVRTAVTINEEAVWPIDQWTRNPVVQGSRRHLLVLFSAREHFSVVPSSNPWPHL